MEWQEPYFGKLITEVRPSTKGKAEPEPSAKVDTLISILWYRMIPHERSTNLWSQKTHIL